MKSSSALSLNQPESPISTTDKCLGDENCENSAKKCRFPVDDSLEWDIFAIPQEAGLHQSRDRRSWFSQFLGLQIGTQFCPGMMIGNENYRRRQS
jgi:hypothetical protein